MKNLKRIAITSACLLILVVLALWLFWPTIGPELVLREFEFQAVTFPSADAVMSGTLVFPKTQSPKAAIVLVHGSGKQGRLLFLANALAGQGFVVLTYDKRGVGQSGGKYEGANNISAENLDLLADDAAAAIRLLAEHPRTRKVPAGLVGISQGGWICPLAATKEPVISFIALWSGPTCTVSEELHFSDLAEKDEKFWDTHSPDEVKQFMQSTRYRDDDVDPRASLRELTIPGLWLFGGRDNSIPVELSVERLKELNDNGQTQFEYRVFPSLGHDNYDDELLRALGDWIKAKAGGFGNTSER